MENKSLQRVQKILSNEGFCSRRKAEELIDEGKVKVNGRLIKLGDKAKKNDKITIDDKPLKHGKKIYLALNKPVGCVTALKDDFKKTIMDYIKIKQRVFPVGRLDYNTSGLLILTNDGDFANKIAHPRNQTTKTYNVILADAISNHQIKIIEEGIKLKDGITSPAIVKKHSNKNIDITIHQGKNRIIRRIFSQIEIRIKKLQRISIGKLKLKNLKINQGNYKFLSKKEKELLFIK